MKTYISNDIKVENYTPEIYNWCVNNLIVNNPTYDTLMRAGKEDLIRQKRVQKELKLFSRSGDTLRIPFGCLYGVWNMIKNNEVYTDFNNVNDICIKGRKSPIELYDYQQETIDKMLKAKSGVLSVPCGGGKGLSLDEKIYTPDGWKRNGDLKIGDYVIGSDGNPTKVIGIFDKGEVPAYKIKFSDNTQIICDKDHLWSVQSQDQRTRSGDFVVKSSEEIFEHYQKIKTRGHELFIPIVKPVSFNPKNISVDPWLLGMILGDGYISEKALKISNTEEDIIERIEKIVGYKLERNPNAKGCDYNFRKETHTLICDLGLRNHRSWEKFVPDNYKYNTVEVRLKLLQGLFDSDGCNSGKGYEISTASEKLAKDIVEIVQSLGGTAKISERTPKYTYKGEKRTGRKSYRVFFKLYKFLPYSSKKHFAKSHNRKKYISAYRKITSIEKTDNIISRCIKVDANDELYVTKDFIVTHNTTIGIELVKLVGKKTLWVTHTKDLLKQAAKEMKNLYPDLDIGFITEGEVDIGKDITVATVQTLDKISPSLYRKEFGTVVVDECQHVSGSPTFSKMFQRVIDNIPARHKFGLSATAYRADSLTKTIYTTLGMSMEGTFEPVHKISRDRTNTLTAEHIRMDVKTSQMPYEYLNADGTIDYPTLIDYLSNSEERNEYIIENVLKCNQEGRKQALLCLRVAHCEYLYEKLKEKGLRVELVTGKTISKKREQTLNEIDNWDVIISTISLFKEGINIKPLDSVHLCSPIKDKTAVIQACGRCERVFEGKKEPKFFDYVDVNFPYCLGAYRKRRSFLSNRE